MNDHIQRIRQLDKQIAELDRITKNGTYLAAGIGVSLTVGKDAEEELSLEFGLTSDLPAILAVLRQALVDCREQRERWAQQERDELCKFFATRGVS
jgi:hypothetical protein